MLTLRQLRYFTTLARTGHFGRAAELCTVSQPALSLQIQAMEQDLGGAVIERSRPGFRLTPLGVEVDRRAQEILAQVQDLAAVAQHFEQALSGPLKLGVIPSIAPYLLPTLLPFLHDHYPDLHLSLREALTATLHHHLQDGGIDLALLALPFPHPRFETLPLFEDPFLFLSPHSRDPAHSPRHPIQISPDDLLLLDEGHCMRDQALTYCQTAPSALQRRYGAASLATIVQMVANGFGTTLLPAIALPVELRGNPQVHVQRFARPEPFRSIGLAWRHSDPRAASFRTLGLALRAQLRPWARALLQPFPLAPESPSA